MSDKPSFFAELKWRNVILMDYADESITLSDLRTRESLALGPIANRLHS
jgi:hypothetical protein